MKKNIDYINLMDIAKINLNEKINNAMNAYKKERNSERKIELIKLLNDRKRLFFFDKEIIEKYL